MKFLANRISESLREQGIESESFHSNKSQNARQRALSRFKDVDIHILVATDIAARGIDIDGIDVVINYDLPHVPETYVHCIGRTGRAEAKGLAWSFCDKKEQHLLKSIEHTTKISILNSALPAFKKLNKIKNGNEALPHS